MYIGGPFSWKPAAFEGSNGIMSVTTKETTAPRRYSIFDDSPEDVVAEVEEWAKMNPVKTRQSVFLEQWPNCLLDGDCVIGLCPRNVDKNYICDVNRSDGCPGCRRKFWGQEVE